MLAGVAIALIAMLAGIASAGISLKYFLQPTGVLIVVGGTLGVTIITTPHTGLLNAVRRVSQLFRNSVFDREALIEEIVSYARVARSKRPLQFRPLLYIHRQQQ